MKEQIDLVAVEEEEKRKGISLFATFSLVLHVILVIWFIRSYRPTAPKTENVPIARYVELIKQNPQNPRNPREFVEAPGPKVENPPMNAPLSDANRKASMPQPNGLTPTNRPGEGRGQYVPPSRAGQRGEQPSMPSTPPTQGAPEARTTPPPEDNPMIYREPTQASGTPRGTVDWNSAIREVGKVASLGGGDGLDMGNLGGTPGSAEQGPLSFESTWYDWGPYAQSMVSKIRVNWYSIMPAIIRTGLQGVVTIRITIQRDGRITDVTILKSSGVPPYDYAAKKAIENSSPLNPLPQDFPNASERVTFMFYYNMEVPPRGR